MTRKSEYYIMIELKQNKAQIQLTIKTYQWFEAKKCSNQQKDWPVVSSVMKEESRKSFSY